MFRLKCIAAITAALFMSLLILSAESAALALPAAVVVMVALCTLAVVLGASGGSNSYGYASYPRLGYSTHSSGPGFWSWWNRPSASAYTTQSNQHWHPERHHQYRETHHGRADHAQNSTAGHFQHNR